MIMLGCHLSQTESPPMLYTASTQRAFAAGAVTVQNPTMLMMGNFFFSVISIIKGSYFLPSFCV